MLVFVDVFIAVIALAIGVYCGARIGSGCPNCSCHLCDNVTFRD